MVLVLKCFNMNCDAPPAQAGPVFTAAGHAHRAADPEEPVMFLLVCERLAEKCFPNPSIFNLKSLPELVVLFLVSIKNWLLMYFMHLYNLYPHTQKLLYVFYN